MMLAKRYITPALYKELTNIKRRGHKMRQYILATSYQDMTLGQVATQHIDRSRILEGIEDPRHQNTVRVHMGSLFLVRGYDIERRGTEGFKLKPLDLPWQLMTLPATLQSPLDRTRLVAAVEFGRALVEEGAPPGELKLLMQALATPLAADAKTLNLDPAQFAIFGHALDPEHVRSFAISFGARPLTPLMQTALESDPGDFLRHYLETPRPAHEDWARFTDAVLVGSLMELNKRFPPTKISSFAANVQRAVPYLALEACLAIVREVSAAFRSDYDYLWPDPERPGQRYPVHVRDFGTRLVINRIVRVVTKHGVHFNDRDINAVLQVIFHTRLNLDPDFGQSEWTSKSLQIPVPEITESYGAKMIPRPDRHQP